MWDNVSLVDDGNGAYRVKLAHLYQHNPHAVFAPQNSNYKQAVAMSQTVIRQLKRKIQLEVFQEEINKNIELGTLVEVSDQELVAIFQSTHHFCYLSMVMSENSESTQARIINNTKTVVPGVGTSFRLENQVPSSKL